MSSLSEILNSLVARNPEEESTLQTLIGFAQSLLSLGHRDLGMAMAAQTTHPELPRILTSLTEEGRTQFFGLVEALEIYQSIHGRAAASILNLEETAVSELRKIRELCLQGGTHAYY